MYLFCYGTLKSGHHNNHYLENQRFIRRAKTKPFYRLFDNGYFPMMIKDREQGYSVYGEIWEIDDEDDAIDILDAHEVLYKRQIIKIYKFKRPVYGYIFTGKLTDNDQECYGHWG